LTVTVEACERGGIAYHNDRRSAFQGVFRRLVAADPRARGTILDIGCGAKVNPVVSDIYTAAAVVHGIDPVEGVLTNEALALGGRWHGELESASLPDTFYDMAIAYNVVEHVRDPAGFLTTAYKTLRPGATLWLLTPNATHPFCRLSRAIELAGLKPVFASRNPSVNDYPAYYRLNDRRSVSRHAKAAGFTAARFVYVPCMQWDQYFPAWLRWGPRLYDAVVGLRVPSAMQIMICQLTKADRHSAALKAD